MEKNDIQIGEVNTSLEITESIGSLGPAEQKKLLAMMMEHLRDHQDAAERRRQDDTITDHAYASEGYE